MRSANALFGLCCALIVGASPALGAEPGDAPAADVARQVERADDGAWIRLDGTVTSVSDDGFSLEGGDRRISVKTKNFPTSARRMVKEGDRVTASGRIDDGVFSRKSVVASALRVSSTGQSYYATDRTAKDAARSPYPDADPNLDARFENGEWVSLTGKVSKIAKGTFTLDTGAQPVTVDARDAGGFETDRLRIGDRVSVSGKADAGLFDRREIAADAVVILPGTGPR